MGKLTAYIPTGKENAVHLDKLVNELGIAPTALKARIKQERIEGTPICSGNSGYWIAANDKERYEFVKLMYLHSISRFKSASKMRQSLENVPGQISLYDAVIKASEGETTIEE